MKTLLKFEASWCGPCQMMKPLAEKIATEHDLELVVVDIDKEPEVARAHDVMAVPTLVLKEGDTEISRFLGMNTKAKIETSLGL